MPKTLISIGALFALAGIVCFVAILGPTHAEGIIPLASAGFSLGILLAAAGLYIQARQIQASLPTRNAQNRKADKLCSLCNQEPAGVFCRLHVLRLCLSCLEKHDDGKNCLYVPAQRATAAYK